MISDSESNLESRLQQQLSTQAEALPIKSDRLDMVRARGRRRQVVSRVAVSMAGLATALAVVGLASVVLDGPTESTSAIGQPEEGNRTNGVDRSDALQVDDADTDERSSTTTTTSAGSDVAPVEPNTTASFGGECLPAPALPDVSLTDPGKRVVRIGSEAELQAAAQNLSPNTVLLLAPGTYELSRTLWVQVDDVTIRGDSNRCDEVILVGKGMENAVGGESVPNGVWGDRANLKVQNLTIRDVYLHAITVNGSGHAPEIYNVRLLDSGEQFIKINPIGFGDGVDDGVVNYAVIKYTDGPPTTDHGGGIGYTQGVDIHAGHGWSIRNSRFENLHTPDDADVLWNAAVLVWNGASNTTVEANVFVNVNRAIAFGLEQSRPEDHSGGVIRNNMIVMSPGLYSDWRVSQSDAAIIVWNSPGTSVLHNTVATRGNTLKSIELRFNSDGAVIRNNLVDAPITDRDASDYADADNVEFEDASIFRNPTVGDLHLVGPLDGLLDGVVDAAPALEDAGHDFDGQARNADSGADVGADEITVPVPNPPVISPPTIEPPTINPPTTNPPTAPTSTSPGTGATTTTKPKDQRASGRRVSETDFRYEGSFRVPDGGNGETTTLAWGGAGLAYNEANDSLFITGHSWHQLTAEISVPALGRSSNPSTLPQASFLQSLQDATDGKLPTIAKPRENTYGRIGGYLVDGDDLIVSGYHYYDAADTQVRSHLVTDTDLGRSSEMVSLTDDVKARWLGGAMAAIPDAWRSDFGGDTYIGGLAGISIVSNSSVGPSAATFSRASFSGADPAELVLGYPLSKPLDEPTTKNDVWNLTSEVRGMVFPEDTSSLLYFGTHGTGDYCYGGGSACGDPVRSSQGTHAYPYRYQIWAYDVDDLAQVFQGRANPESIRPYDVWELDLPYSPRQVEIGGTAYDSASGRIFISQAFADGEQPVIHVYTLR